MRTAAKWSLSGSCTPPRFRASTVTSSAGQRVRTVTSRSVPSVPSAPMGRAGSTSRSTVWVSACGRIGTRRRSQAELWPRGWRVCTSAKTGGREDRGGGRPSAAGGSGSQGDDMARMRRGGGRMRRGASTVAACGAHDRWRCATPCTTAGMPPRCKRRRLATNRRCGESSVPEAARPRRLRDALAALSGPVARVVAWTSWRHLKAGPDSFRERTYTPPNHGSASRAHRGGVESHGTGGTAGGASLAVAASRGGTVLRLRGRDGCEGTTQAETSAPTWWSSGRRPLRG